MQQSNEERVQLLTQSDSFGNGEVDDSEDLSAFVPPGEALPVRVRVARTEEQLWKAVKVRVDAYGKHTPGFANALRTIEREDKEKRTLVLLCESKITGEPVGTLRIHTNFDAPTYLERTLQLPNFLRRSGIAYVTRLAVASGPGGAFVKLALFKALYRYCFATQISWILAVARDPVDREFVRLGFSDLLPLGTKLHRPADFGDVDVRPLYFNVHEAENQWRTANHPLYEFMIRKVHPDIEIFASVNSAWSMPRQTRQTRGREGNQWTAPIQIMAV